MTIKGLRIQAGMTQKAFAEYLGIPHRTIQNWEGGQRTCPEYVEKMILDKLHQRDYKTILEEIMDMLKSDLPHLKTEEAKNYVTNVIDEIKDSL